MKGTHISHRGGYRLIVALVVVVTVGVVVSLVIGYGKLRELWLSQCVIRHPSTQIAITSGIMVKADVIAECLGLKIGANLAEIDFTAKREELLKRVPNLKSIAIRRYLPDRIEVIAEERTPMARIGFSGSNRVTGKVADSEGVVFIWQRDTNMLPLIREHSQPGTAAGYRLRGRSRAALDLLDVVRDGELSELNVLEVDTSKRDYLLLTFGSELYSRAKIVWEGMDDEPTPESRASLIRQLTHLLKASRSSAGRGVRLWNVTDTSRPGRVYGDTDK